VPLLEQTLATCAVSSAAGTSAQEMPVGHLRWEQSPPVHASKHEQRFTPTHRPRPLHRFGHWPVAVAKNSIAASARPARMLLFSEYAQSFAVAFGEGGDVRGHGPPRGSNDNSPVASLRAMVRARRPAAPARGRAVHAQRCRGGSSRTQPARSGALAARAYTHYYFYWFDGTPEFVVCTFDSQTLFWAQKPRVSQPKVQRARGPLADFDRDGVCSVLAGAGGCSAGCCGACACS
jgi:hypothetical protein